MNTDNNFDMVKKPPLGLIPLFIHKEQRLDEIRQAISRFNDFHQHKKLCPQEWLDEKHELEKWLWEFNKSKQSPVKEERIEVGKMFCREGEEGYGKMKWNLNFKTNKHIHYDKAIDLCNLLERYLNGEMDNPPIDKDTSKGEKKFKIGDVVRKSNGITKMTVEGYGYNNDNYHLPFVETDLVRVVYFRPNGQLRRKTISESKLILDVPIKYPQQEVDAMMLNVWNAARKGSRHLTDRDGDMIGGLTYRSFEDYQSTLNQPSVSNNTGKEYELDNGMGTTTKYSTKDNVQNDWEIKTFRFTFKGSCFNSMIERNEDGTFGMLHIDENCFIESNIHEIHSVLRKSDNTVFTVGDEVQYGSISLSNTEMKVNVTIIESFGIKEKDIWAYGKNGFFIAPLINLRKSFLNKNLTNDIH